MLPGKGQHCLFMVWFLHDPGGEILRQHRTIPALRLKHRSGSCGTASALPKRSIMSGCGTRIVLRGQKPLALCDRCPCFGSLFPPLAALTFCSIQYYLRFWLSICRTSLAVSALRIMRYCQCLYATSTCAVGNGLDRSGALPLQKSLASICFLIPFSAR